MSDVSQGPGWWLASDEQWHAPELHPDHIASRPPVTTDQIPAIRPGSGTSAPRRFRRGARLAVAAAVVVAILAVGAVAGAVVLTAAFPTGTGSAKITWHSVSGQKQPYNGSIAGIPVSGRAVAASNGGTTSPMTLARWTGTFDGKSFNLTVSISWRGSLSHPSKVTVHVAGTYGTLPVNGTARPVGNTKATFKGTIGPHQAVGTVTFVTQHGSTGSAKATFTVTG